MGVYYGIHIMIYYIYTYRYIADGGFNQLVSEVTPGQRLA